MGRVWAGSFCVCCLGMFVGVILLLMFVRLLFLRCCVCWVCGFVVGLEGCFRGLVVDLFRWTFMYWLRVAWCLFWVKAYSIALGFVFLGYWYWLWRVVL